MISKDSILEDEVTHWFGRYDDLCNDARLISDPIEVYEYFFERAIKLQERLIYDLEEDAKIDIGKSIKHYILTLL